MTLKDVKKKFIIDVACKLFLERSINEVTIRDVAQSAGVGEATVYRYFDKKHRIAVAVAEKLQKQVFTEYFSMSADGNGYMQIEKFFQNYVDIFVSSPSFFKFIKEFDAYMLSEGGADSDEYSSGMDLFKNVFFSAYERGIKDGSVKEIKNAETFYFSTTHALLELCKKLSLEHGIIKQDETTDKVAEISELKEIILSYIANPHA